MFKPRIIVALLGIDQHEVGAVAVAGLLRDAGMEVIYLGRYNTPATLLRAARDEDADVIGISCHSWEYLQYTPVLLDAIAEQGLDVQVVLGGSVITEADAAQLRAIGVADIFGPQSSSEQIVSSIRALAAARQERARSGTS
ncbi:MAG: cobalamin B12-binding domain-containing protein [Burkholderiales bacterium]|nr:cobalamin B12-binding domain-containing protein [Burkholderiales bacterium]